MNNSYIVFTNYLLFQYNKMSLKKTYDGDVNFDLLFSGIEGLNLEASYRSSVPNVLPRFTVCHHNYYKFYYKRRDGKLY